MICGCGAARSVAEQLEESGAARKRRQALSEVAEVSGEVPRATVTGAAYGIYMPGQPGMSPTGFRVL